SPRLRQPQPLSPYRYSPLCWSAPSPDVRCTPTEQRDRIGLVTSLVETTQQVLTRPTAFFRAMPVTGGIGGPLFYGVIVGYAGLVAAGIYGAIFQAVAGPRLFDLPHRAELERFLPYLQGGTGLLFPLVLGPVLLGVVLFIC